MAGKTNTKQYKLKATDGRLSRDDVCTWDYNHQAFCRQNSTWTKFLPAGTKNTWTASDDDEANGFIVMKAPPAQDQQDDDATNTLRASFKDFLTCLAVHAPSGFMETIMRESTSYKWVLDKIKSTFSLNTKGHNFLEGYNMKLEFSDTFTYQQGWMFIKDFYSSSLLNSGSKFMTKTLNSAETLSPLAYNFLVREWLVKIHKELPDHVQKTRGHLFTLERPTLACNQEILCDLIDTMLQEIDTKDSIAENNINIGYVNARGRGGYNRGHRTGRGRGFSNNQQPYPRSNLSCSICLEARRNDSSITHAARDCPWRFRPKTSQNQNQSQRNPNFKVLLVPNHNDQQTDLYGPPMPNTQLPRQQTYNAAVTAQSSLHEAYEDLYQPEEGQFGEDDDQHFGGGPRFQEL